MPYARNTKLGRMKSKVDAFIRRVEGKVPYSTHPALANKPGKLYEYCIVDKILEIMIARGWKIRWSGGQLLLKGGPGAIRPTEPHFSLINPSNNQEEFKLYVNIEVRTVGAVHAHHADLSSKHEVDVGIFACGSVGYPSYQDLYLMAECKCVASFDKIFVRNIIGIRHELSHFCCLQTEYSPLSLSSPPNIAPHLPTDAPEFYMFSIDPRITNYRNGPGRFNIELQHYAP